jgi:plasmid stability protein
MAQLVVRDLEEEMKARLKRRAERHGRSMEDEIRRILRNAVKESGRSDRPLMDVSHSTSRMPATPPRDSLAYNPLANARRRSRRVRLRGSEDSIMARAVSIIEEAILMRRSGVMSL